MADAARNEWQLPDALIARVESQAVIAPLDCTPFRLPCQASGCMLESHRERVIGQEHPYVFRCDHGHETPTAAIYRY